MHGTLPRADTYRYEEPCPSHRSSLLASLYCIPFEAWLCWSGPWVLLMMLSVSLCPRLFCMFQHNHKDCKRTVRSCGERGNWIKVSGGKWNVFAWGNSHTNPLCRKYSFAIRYRLRWRRTHARMQRWLRKSPFDSVQCGINLAGKQ